MIAGVLTTAVDYVVFAIVNEALKSGAVDVGTSSLIATVVSWVAAVLFAYISNKLVVFRNYDFSPSHVIKESSGFFAARLLSGIITVVLIYIFVKILGMNEYLAKIGTSVFNLVFNYVASKLFIFKKS